MVNGRQIAAGFLVLLVLIPIVGVGSLFLWELLAIKREVSERIYLSNFVPHEQVTLRFHILEAEKELEWEHAREFEYKGEMYDVISVESMGDTLIYHCLWDHAETLLKSNFKKSIAKQWDNKENYDLRFSLFVGTWLLYLTPDTFALTQNSFFKRIEIKGVNAIAFYKSLLDTIYNPPERYSA